MTKEHGLQLCVQPTKIEMLWLVGGTFDDMPPRSRLAELRREKRRRRGKALFEFFVVVVPRPEMDKFQHPRIDLLIICESFYPTSFLVANISSWQ